MNNDAYFRLNDSDWKKWQQIREYIFQKHGKINGIIGKEAINLMMSGLEHTQSNTHTHRKTKRTYNSYQQLLFSMQEYKQVRNTELIEIIDNACGRGARDNRTFKKNKKFLLEDDIIITNTSIPFKSGKQIYDINHKKLMFKLRSFSGTIEDYAIKSATKTRQSIQTEVERSLKPKADIDFEKQMQKIGVVKI